ncbi:hypothetical protein [Nocardia otitidiscaviarum]|uniref:hypothetical protein n=1 Tax=Nocardia otitidiscaviarum TaxID=1823 RepID=UPI00163D4857|nr:hypothetical protein [Nocardia otitidiscaviarum]MBF6182238.1 hypothetical protein [Nocardia otitidiscaviarum]MCP9618748.1 hypothetical protein [Nocardia otitidiscaviarum]
MTPNRRTRALWFGVVAAAIVGLIDAATGRTWDLVTVFGIIGLLGVLGLVRFGGRATLSVRTDLARWLAQRAAEGGEPVHRVADRAIAAYRAGIIGDDERQP